MEAANISLNHISRESINTFYNPVEEPVSEIISMWAYLHNREGGRSYEECSTPQEDRKTDSSVSPLRQGPDWQDEAMSELERVFKECSHENWDGYGALAISSRVYSKARQFLKLVPSSIPKPEIVPESEDEIGFEWYLDQDASFVVSVKDSDKISFAGLFRKNREVWGVELFEDAIPQLVYENVRKLFSRLNGF